MLSKDLLEALNDQMNHEYFAAHAYMAMAAYCDDASYEGFANFYIQQAKEERFHGKKSMIISTIVVNMLNLNQYQLLKLNLNLSLKHLRWISTGTRCYSSFYNLSEIAQKDKDYATISFLNWFLDEQVEEESTFETHIDYLNRIGDDCNTLYLYEKELAARSFDEE